MRRSDMDGEVTRGKAVVTRMACTTWHYGLHMAMWQYCISCMQFVSQLANSEVASITLSHTHFITLAASSGKRNVSIWHSSGCLSHWRTHRNSPGGSKWHVQRTFSPDNKEDQHTRWSGVSALASEFSSTCCLLSRLSNVPGED